jgi:hypothetical protein
MAYPTDIGPVQIWVYVEPADADQRAIGQRAEKILASAVERIRAAGPIGTKPIQESEALRDRLTPKKLDIRRKRAQASEMNLLVHLPATRPPRNDHGCGPS